MSNTPKEVTNANNDVMSFLLDNIDVNNQTADIYPGDRFIAAGKPFTIRVMTQKEFDRLQRKCSTSKTVRGKRETDFDSGAFNNYCVTECVVKPDFKDASAIQKAGVTTPEQFVEKVLLPGEVADIAAEVLALSGFDKSLDEMKDEVKND